MDIQRNFEFLYFASGKGYHPDTEILDAPYDLLRLMGGKEEEVFNSQGMDMLTQRCSRSYSYEVRLFRFPEFEAVCTREEYPEHEDNPICVTRVRLGNYRHDDHLVRILSEGLAKIPTDNLEGFVAH